MLSAGDQSAKPAAIASGCLILIQERELLFFELIEEIFPTDFLQRFFSRIPGVIYAQNTRLMSFILCLANCRRVTAALFHPVADFIVIRRDMAAVPRTARFSATSGVVMP